MIIFWGYLIVGFLMVFLYELEFLTPTDIGSDANLVFFMQVLMESDFGSVRLQSFLQRRRFSMFMIPRRVLFRIFRISGIIPSISI